MRRLLPLLFTLFLVVGVSAYTATPTGYYLPRGYKVDATVRVPAVPAWPGENVGDIAGLSTNDYSVYVVAYGGRGGILEGFATEQGIKIVWVQGGTQQVKAKVRNLNEGDHTVTIVYGHDNYIKISIDGKLAFSFVATVDKYELVAQGASVNAPQPIPQQQDGSSDQTGEGYDVPSIPELQTQYLLLGAGLVFISILAVVMVKRRS